MSKQKKSDLENPNIPTAATVLKANDKQKKSLKKDNIDECNDATQCSV